MARLKIVRRKNKQKKDGTAPLALRISKQYTTNYKFLGQYVLEKDWDIERGLVRRSHPNSGRLNNFLRKKLTAANDILMELEGDNNAPSSAELKKRVKGQSENVSFFDLARERIKNKRLKGTFSVANAEQSILNNIEKFTGNNRLQFQDITPAFLEKFKTFCVHQRSQKTRTVTNQLIFIRTLFNIAIKDGNVDQKYYPFAGEKEKIKLTSGHKIGLTIEEIEAIENLDLDKGSNIWHTRNVWLFAFYFAGIRISDVLKLKWGDFKDGRLFYVMNKNEKPLSLIVPDKAKAILKRYKKSRTAKNEYVFPFLNKADQQSKRDIFVKSRNATSLFNKYLKRIAGLCDIDKNLSNHIARHSFGNIAGDHIHPLMLQKLYRHSDLKTTLNYQANFIHKEADDALETVVNF